MAKKFPLIFDFQANIGPIQTAIGNLQTSLSKINLPASFQKSLDSSFLKLNEEIRTFQSLSRGGFSNLSETTKAQSSFNKIIGLIDKINLSIEDIEGIDPQKLLPQDALKRLEKVQVALKKLKEVETKKSNIEKDIAAETKEYEKQKGIIGDLVNKRSLLTSKKKNQTTKLDKVNSDLEKTRNELDALTTQMNAFTAEGGKKADPQYQRMLADFKALSQQQGASVKSQIKFNNEIQESEIQLAELKTALSNARKELKATEERLEQLNQLSVTPEGLDDLRSTIAQLKGLNIDDVPTDLNEINRILGSFNDEELEQVKKQLAAISEEGKKIPDVIRPAKKELDGVGDTAKGLNDVASEMKNLQSNILQFFSISNAIQLFKNAVRDAFETVKELDSVMTEIAVVSDFSVSDMWDKLPEFTEQANELGVSIKDAYAATTLFVQQGLNLNDSMELSGETLKMARIAGMDAAEATDAMTAALRGFNMELSETSAQRVNDVYSELAAITAADTEEISTAMTKTASIAHNANMEFETTAAFLSQIIETTRESAETAGTAMKTVIARFQELKKDPAEIGEVDGEIVDANKIETALRTIGVSLRDTSGQFRDLDEVFLEIASKWDSLDTNTQRYIATMAAGSRQQSRFIAMMSDYDRTMELVGAANNSAGSSQEQFNKTLDSLESKLERLSNAWDEFVTGITNSDIIKGGVDFLTGLLEAINKLTDLLGEADGLGKIAVAGGAIWGGSKLFKKLFNEKSEGFAQTIKELIPLLAKQKVTQEAVNAEEAVGLISKIKNTAATISSKKATEGLTLSTIKAAAAQNGLNAAISMSPLGWLALAFGVVAGAAVLYDAVIEDSAEKTERLNNELNAAKDAADSAKQSFEDIKTAFDDYDNTQTTLSELTKGTEEWRNALYEANNQVLELIKTYPKLAQYVERGEDGQLILNEEGRKAFIEEKQQGATNAQYATAGLNYRVSENSLNIAQDEYYKNFRYNPGGKDVNTNVSLEALELYRTNPEAFSQKETFTAQDLIKLLKTDPAKAEKIWSANEWDQKTNMSLGEYINKSEPAKWMQGFNDAEFSLYTDELYDLAENTGAAIEVLYSSASDLNDYLITETENETAKRTDILNALISSSPDLDNYGRQLQDVFSQTFNLEAFDAQLEEKVAEIQAEGLNLDQLKERYLEETKLEELPEELENASAEAFEYALASIKLFGDDEDGIAKDFTKFFNESFKNLEAGAKHSLLSLAEEGGSGLTTAMAEGFSAINLDKEDWYDSFSETLKTSGINEANFKALAESLGYSTEEYAKIIVSNSENAIDKINESYRKLSNVGIGTRSIKESNISQGSYSGLMDNLYEVWLSEGQEAALGVRNEISSILESGELKDEEVERFVSTLNSIDWTNRTEVEGLSDVLKEFGFSTEFCEGAINEFEDELIEFADSVNKLSLDQLKTELKDYESLTEKIKDADGDLVFNKDEYDDLIAAGASSDDFIATGIDEWTYIGGETNSLLTSIEEHVAQLNNDWLGSRQEQIQHGERFGRHAGDTVNYDGKDYTIEAIAAGLTDGSFLASDFDASFLSQLINATGANWNNNDLSGATVEQLADVLINAFNTYGVGGSILATNQSEAAQYSQTEADLRYGQMSGVELNASTAQTEEEIAAKEKAYEKMRREIEKTGKSTKGMNKEQIALEKDLIDSRKAVDGLNKSLEDNFNVLKDGNVGSEEYITALNEVATAASAAFGTELSAAFVQENIEDFKLLAEGGAQAEEAFRRIGVAAAKDFSANLGLAEEDLNIVNGLIDEIDEQNVEIGGEADFSQIFSQLAALMGSVEDAAAVIESMGYEVTWELDGYTTIENPNWKPLSKGGKPGEQAYFTYPNYRTVATRVRDGSNVTGNRRPSGGGGGGGGSSDKYEPDYDKHHNLQQRVDAGDEELSDIAEEYDEVLNDSEVDAAKLLEITNREKEALQEQLDLRRQLLQARKDELAAWQEENKEYSEFFWYDEETGKIMIDQEAIEKANLSAEEGEKVDAAIQKGQEIVEQVDENEDAIKDLEKTEKEIARRGEQEYADLQDRMLDAIIAREQEKIDDLEKINESINEASADLLDSIQSNIDKMRQDRANQEAEDSLAEKERRLAYLRLDTTGAHNVEIMQLEDEIAQERQDYEDSRIDQSLQQLQDQNDKAAEQREKQITLAQSQLEWAQKNGVYAEEAKRLVDDMIAKLWSKEAGVTVKESEGYKLLEKVEGSGKSLASIDQWGQSLAESLALAGQYEASKDYKQEIIDSYIASGGKWTSSMSQLNRARNNKIRAEELNYPELSDKEMEEEIKAELSKRFAGDQMSKMLELYKSSGTVTKEIKELNKIRNQKLQYIGEPEFVIPESALEGELKKRLADGVKRYKTGGLADFTGLAWLDGTTSHPELVLNAKDTENFIQLKDTLSSIRHLPGAGGLGGDNYFDVDVHVDELSNDYDVDQLANRIKGIIYEDSMYRNVNAINLLR